MRARKGPTAEAALGLWLDELENELAAVDAAYADAQWREHFGRAGNAELSRLEVARAELLLDPEKRQRLQDWRGRPHDPVLARRVTLCWRRFRWAEIESQPEIYALRNRIDQSIVAFCPQVNGVTISRTERAQILRDHPDRARRREAWLALAPLSERIEADVRELLRRRQRLARRLGYAGLVDWALDVTGLNREWVMAQFEQLDRLTAIIYRDWLAASARRLGLAEGLCPWDLAFAAERGVALPDEAFPRTGGVPSVQAIAAGWGLDRAAAGVRVDVTALPYAGLCYVVRPPDDVRVLLDPRDGHCYYRALFHEFGHAVYQRALRPASPALGWTSPSFDEAMGALWARLAWEPDWLATRDGLTPRQVTTSQRGWAERMMYQLRKFIAQATFEYQACADPDADLLKLQQETYAAYLGVPHTQMSGWVDGPFWTSHPVYWQHYVIAEMVASQTLTALRQEFGRLVGEQRVGEWLRERYYAPGASRPWADRVRRATGAVLSVDALLQEIKEGLSPSRRGHRET